MPIDPKRIASDLTLELDEQAVTASEFQKAVDHFLGLIREVAKNTAPTKDASSWLVDVYGGSVGIGLRATPDYSQNEVRTIRDAVVKGLHDLKSGKKPSGFSDRALEHSKQLSSIVNRQNMPTAVRIWAGKKVAAPLSTEVAKSVASVLAPAYEEEGTVDGFLQKLDAHKGYEFVIYDSVNGRAIECYVDEALLNEAHRAFRKRVEVSGTVHYRRDGQPVSVRAREIIRFPDENEIPSVEQMRELLKGA